MNNAPTPLKRHLTKFIHPFAFQLQLLNEIGHFALLRQPPAVVHQAHVDIRTSCKIRRRFTVGGGAIVHSVICEMSSMAGN